jgi:hypothetical protein
MYLQQYGLKEFPFLASPDSRFLYVSDQVNEAIQKCLYMIENRIGPLFVYGPIGTGKTTLAKRLHQLLEQHPEQYVLAYLVIPPQLSVNALLRLVMDEFSVKTSRSYTGSVVLASIAAVPTESRVQADASPTRRNKAETQRWNGQFFPVRTRADVRAYCRHNVIPAERPETATLTKCGASSAPARPEPRRHHKRTSCYNDLHAGE